jgi:hypothetical protein
LGASSLSRSNADTCVSGLEDREGQAFHAASIRAGQRLGGLSLHFKAAKLAIFGPRTLTAALFAGCVALSSCAGRDAQPISTVQQEDAYSDCAIIRAEIDANNQKAQQLANEQGMKVAQNVAAGVVDLVIWPVWFGMDFKGAAGQDAANLQARQQYLTQLAVQRCEVAPFI